ncbi:MAG: zinc-ribbon domain-containing protein [Myxococcales bacterium]|nr:zinc-ribbon domain-containing protein [Myxococcales bacterium]
MHVTCASCMAPYDVDDQRIPPSGKVRCPKCGTSAHVPTSSQGVSDVEKSAAAKAAPRLPPPALGRPPRALSPPLGGGADPALPKPVMRTAPQGPPKYVSRLADLPGVKRPVLSTPIATPAVKPESKPERTFDTGSDLPQLKRSAEAPIEPQDENPFVIDLPAPTYSDLPVPKVAQEHEETPLELDFPVAKRDVSLPAPKIESAAWGQPASVGSDAPALDFSDLDMGISEPPPSTVRGGGAFRLPTPPRDDVAVLGEEVTRAVDDEMGLILQSSGSPELPIRRAAPGEGIGEDAAFADLFGNSEPASRPVFDQDIESVELGDVELGDMDLELEEPGGNEALAFGEVDLGVGGGGEAMEFSDIPEEPHDPGLGLLPEAVEAIQKERQAQLDSQETKPKFKVGALLISLGVLVLILGAGASLGFTKHGYFGMYTLEQWLPAAGDDSKAHHIIQKAQALVLSDTYADGRAALRLLSEGRKTMGLNRLLLSRSLVYEAHFQLRFGQSHTSGSHIKLIAHRLEERGWNVPDKELAQAAQAVGQNAYPKAQSHLNQGRAKAGEDVMAALISGELGHKAGRMKDAERDFQTALKLGGKAAAEWGLLRVYVQQHHPEQVQQALRALETLSPLHSGARLIKAHMAWNEGSKESFEEAARLAREVAGKSPVNGKLLAASKTDRAAALSLLGLIHEREGRLGEANQAFLAALVLDPGRDEALLGAGRVLLRDKRPGDALARFEIVINAKADATPHARMPPMTTSGQAPFLEAKLGAAEALLAMGRPQMAKDALEPLLKEYAREPLVSLWLGKAEVELEHHDVAEKHFQETIRLAPTDFAGYLALSQLYVDIDEPVKAVQVLRQAEGRVPDSADRRRMVGRSELARGNIDAALESFRGALEFEPRNLAAQFDLAVGLRHAGRLDEAKAQLDAIEKQDHQYPELALERGRIFEARGEWDVAVRNYRLALEKAPKDSALLLRLGASEVEAGHVEAAEATLNQVAKLRPNSADVAFFLGRVAFAKANYNDALIQFQRATALDAKQGDYHMFAGWAALELGSLGQALEFANEALKLDASLGDAYWVRGRIKLRAGAVKDARDDFAHALKLKPSRYEIYTYLGDAYDQLRQVRSAIDAYRTALSYDKERGDWWARLGALFMDAGQPHEANQALAQAVQIGDRQAPVPGWLPEAHRIYAEALSLGGLKNEALKHYQKYLDIAPPTALDRHDVEAILKGYAHGQDR